MLNCRNTILFILLKIKILILTAQFHFHKNCNRGNQPNSGGKTFELSLLRRLKCDIRLIATHDIQIEKD